MLICVFCRVCVRVRVRISHHYTHKTQTHGIWVGILQALCNEECVRACLLGVRALCVNVLLKLQQFVCFKVKSYFRRFVSHLILRQS